MSPRAEVAAPRRHPKRLRVEALEARLVALLGRDGGARPGMLAVSLLRADRTRALARRPDAFEVLAGVLDRIDATLRPDDRYAAVSATEIWVLLADAPTEALLRLAATALRDGVGGHYRGRYDDGGERSVEVRAAVGAAFVDALPVTPGAAVEAATRALSEARRCADRLAVTPTSDTHRMVRARLERRVREVIEANALEVWFQPQVRLDDRRCASFEALVRWPHREGETPVQTADLVSVCEETGQIDELTWFIVNTVLRRLAAWRADGFEPRVGVNLSALTLADASFPARIAQACSLWEVPAGGLLFELTESSIARHETATIEFMHRLRELGCGLAIDDFGTGYSSFAYLRQFPVDELKIDRSFVLDLATERGDRRIVRTLVDVAHAFGLRALAEGVEDEATARALAELGCDAAQGWHFARALPGDEAAAWAARFNAHSARAAEASLSA
jgi:EAL domain-containing protein (putative c-di-GMP-specific phosphodiesterase class I)